MLALEQLGRCACLAPETSGRIVYDQQADDFDLSILESLKTTRSTRLSSTPLARRHAHDDILWLALQGICSVWA